MSHYDDDTAMRDEEMDGASSHHHHHHSKNHAERHWTRHWAEENSAWIAVGVVFFFLVLFGLMFGLYWALSAETQNHVHTHAMELESLKARVNPYTSSSALYSLSGSGHVGEYRSTVCHADLYQVAGGTTASTNNTISLQRLPTDQYSQLIQSHPYAIQARIIVRYAVEPANIPIGSGSGNKEERYIVTQVALATYYPAFSTIRLVESRVDNYKRVVRPVRSLTLCSDNLESSVGPCRQYVTMDGAMEMNNTYTVTMDQPQQPDNGASGKPSTNRSGGGKMSSNDIDGVSVSNDKLDRRVLIDSISHIRLYHLLFYVENGRDDRGHTGGGDHDDKSFDYGGEYQVLSAQVKPC